MPTRNINLTDHLDRFIDREVKSGRYRSASEVVREGLRLMRERKREEREKLQLLRASVQEGIDAIDRGDCIEFASSEELSRYIDQIFKEVIREHRARKKRCA
jgi:antitoxin ParD1/3/4